MIRIPVQSRILVFPGVHRRLRLHVIHTMIKTNKVLNDVAMYSMQRQQLCLFFIGIDSANEVPVKSSTKTKCPVVIVSVGFSALSSLRTE
jgi:hypothetical protein